MFGNFFSFQSKNKEGKPPKDENQKKNKNKKGKDNKKDGTEAATEENQKENVQVIKDEEEQFEEIRGNSSNVDHTDVSTISNDVSDHQNDQYRNGEHQNDQRQSGEHRNDQHRNDQHQNVEYRNVEHRNGDGMIPSVPELLQQLQQVENEARRLADGLEQMTADKAALEREMNALRTDNDRLRSNTETMVAEKWELSAANADLQNRLQSMAMTYMQGTPDTMLQEELHKLQMALSDERKVTEKLSRNLELEKRRSESLEQKAKSANRRSGASVTGIASVLPEEVRQRDDVLSNSMEKFRIHCERLSSSLDDCEKKLTGFEIQEDYHAADLRKELQAVRRLLNEDRRRSSGESQKLFDAQTLFGQVYKDYNNLVEAMKHQAHDKRASRGNQHDSKDDSRENVVDAETSLKLRRALEEVEQERQKVEHVSEKLKRCEAELETIPLLRAQVDVYRSDFNAEREARQKIAGEKADLAEELHRLRQHDREIVVADNHADDVAAARRNPRPIGEPPRLLPTTNFVRETAHQFAEMAPRGPSPPPRPQKPKETKAFNCPKCGKSFPILQLLQNHVNDCLDRE